MGWKTFTLLPEAWIYRACDLGILSKEQAERLFKQFRMNGWYKQEPGPALPSESSCRMEMLIRNAYIEGIISDSCASELMRIPLVEWVKKSQPIMENANMDGCHHG